jgi:hypothetical protein
MTTQNSEIKIERGDHMKKRAFVLAACALFMAVAVCYAADDVFTGTWKLDEAKSKIAAGSPKNSLVVYAMSGDSVTVTIAGTGADGNPIHITWTGKYDGKDYPVTGDSAADMRSYTKVNSHTLMLTSRKAGKVVNTIRVVVSADGKTRTVTTTSTDDKGVKTTTTSYYNKQ